MASGEIFRKSALERLSSPEQLDRLVVVTDPMGWLALATVGVLLLSALFWGIFGRIPYNVTGEGILVSGGGRVFDAVSASQGVVSQVLVSANQSVAEGEVLVLIDQPALEQETRSARSLLSDRETERTTVLENQAAELVLKTQNFGEQKQAQRQIISAARQRERYLEERLARIEELSSSGLLSRQATEDLRQEFDQVQQTISEANNRILEIDALALDLQSRHAREKAELDQKVAEARHRVDELEANLARTTRVISPTAGTVTEVTAAAGAVVSPGTSVATIAKAGRHLQVALYIPTRDGKKVRKGMQARVEPASVRREEYGTLVGEITEVSEFPATREGMLAILQNEALVDRFAAAGAPYFARVRLTVDESTASGYRWSSRSGPDLQVSAGTTATAEVTVRKVAPISLVMPFLRRQTGIGFSGTGS